MFNFISESLEPVNKPSESENEKKRSNYYFRRHQKEAVMRNTG